MLVYQIIHGRKGYQKWKLLRTFQKIFGIELNDVKYGKKRVIDKKHNFILSSVEGSIRISFLIEPKVEEIIKFESDVNCALEKFKKKKILIEKRYKDKKELLEV